MAANLTQLKLEIFKISVRVLRWNHMMSFGLITVRRPLAVQPFRQNTCWDAYAYKERLQTHFKTDKDCLDSSNDYIAIAQFCDIQFTLSFDGVCLFMEKYCLDSFTWTTGHNDGSGKLFVIIVFLDHHVMIMSWHGRYGVYLKLCFVMQVLWSQLCRLIRGYTAWGQKLWVPTVNYLGALWGTQRVT